MVAPEVMGRYRVKLMALANGEPHEFAGKYIVSYNPDHHNGKDYEGGHLICTPDPAGATAFEFSEAVSVWQSGPSCRCHRKRPDGMPNRPLTAFHVCIEPVLDLSEGRR